MNKYLSFLFLISFSVFFISCSTNSNNTGKKNKETTAYISQLETEVANWNITIQNSPVAVPAILANVAGFELSPEAVMAVKSAQNNSDNPLHVYLSMVNGQLQTIITDKNTELQIKTGNFSGDTVLYNFNTLDSAQVNPELQKGLSSTKGKASADKAIPTIEAQNRIGFWQNTTYRDLWIQYHLSNPNTFLRAFTVPLKDASGNGIIAGSTTKIFFAFAFKPIEGASLAGKFDPSKVEVELIVKAISENTIDPNGTVSSYFADVTAPVPPLKPGDNFNLF